MQPIYFYEDIFIYSGNKCFVVPLTSCCWRQAALVTYLHLYFNLDSTILFASSRYLQNRRRSSVLMLNRKVLAMKAVCHKGSISLGDLKNCWQEEVFSWRAQEQLTRAGGQACPVPWPPCREILPEAPFSLLQPPLHHQQTSLAVMVMLRPASVLFS